MQPDVILIWIGALLLMAGLVFTAVRALGLGRLSEPRLTRAPAPGQTQTPGQTLEPRARNAGLHLTDSWPGLAMAGLGALLLLAGAAF
jgi:hypothetical protein